MAVFRIRNKSVRTASNTHTSGGSGGTIGQYTVHTRLSWNITHVIALKCHELS